MHRPFWFFLVLQADLFDERRPLLWVAGQQFFVLHILLMDDRVGIVLRIPRAVLLAHFQGIENVDGRGAVPVVRQRGDHVRVKLVFAALHRNIRPGTAHDLHELVHIARHFLLALLHLLFSSFDLNLPSRTTG